MKKFLLHILPSGFVKIRHYGILGNPCKKRSFELCFLLIGPNDKDRQYEVNNVTTVEDLKLEPFICPHCKKGKLILINEIPSKRHSPPVTVKKAG